METVRARFPQVRRSEFHVAIEADLNKSLCYDIEQACRQNAATLGRVKFWRDCETEPELPGFFKKKLAVRYARVGRVLTETGRLHAIKGVEMSFRNQSVTQPLTHVLVDQFNNFRLCVREEGADSVRHNPDARWSGKSGGRKDDLCISALSALWFLVRLVATKYRRIIRGMTLVPGLEDEDGVTVQAIEADREFAGEISLGPIGNFMESISGEWVGVE